MRSVNCKSQSQMSKPKKTGRIEICDSKRKKGMFFVRVVGANGEKLMHGECLTSVANVNKHIVAVCSVFWPQEHIEFVIGSNAIDRTAREYWHRKYGIEKG